MKFHPLAECLPMLPGHEFDELVNDIRKNGLRVPVTLFEEKILDGRNRYAACKTAKVKPRYDAYEGDDPVGFILSHNINRRHLPAGKRADYALRIFAAGEIWASGGRPKKDSRAPTLDEVAKLSNVSKKTVQRAKKKAEKEDLSQHGAEKTWTNVHVFDSLGYPVPAPALLYWNRRDEVKEILRQFTKMRSWAEEMNQRQDPLYCEVNLNSVRVELNNLYQSIKGALPYVVCTLCDGMKPETCDLCKGRGVISEFRWKHALPEEDRVNRQKQIETISQVA